MRIHFDEAHRLFHLRTSEMSYAFGIAADGRLRHLYWGPSLSSDDSLLPLAETMLAAYEPSKGVDARKDGVAELPTMEPSDYGDPVPPEGVLVAVTPDASVLLAGGLVALSSPKVHADQSICCPLDEVGAGVGVLVGAGVSVITVWKSCFPLLSRALPASTTRSGSI